MEINEFSMGLIYCRYGDQFPLQALKRSFFVSCIDLFALKIEASAKQSKKINETNKNNNLFYARSGNGSL